MGSKLWLHNPVSIMLLNMYMHGMSFRTHSLLPSLPPSDSLFPNSLPFLPCSPPFLTLSLSFSPFPPSLPPSPSPALTWMQQTLVSSLKQPSTLKTSKNQAKTRNKRGVAADSAHHLPSELSSFVFFTFNCCLLRVYLVLLYHGWVTDVASCPSMVMLLSSLLPWLPGVGGGLVCVFICNNIMDIVQNKFYP